jgi:amidase
MTHDITPYSTATEMLAALRAKAISARELYAMHRARIEERDGQLNSIVVNTFDRGEAAAKEADRRIAAGEDAPLLGLPMTLKESEAVAGLPQTAGIPELKDNVAASDGIVPARCFAAGAALLGKTNIPVALGDWQADSPVYGRTNNPWNLGRSPGGSTGGGSAALAAGLTPLEVGSDIGGSIRVPAAFTGVYGHRPSESAVPRTGAFPGSQFPLETAIMGTQGPLARSAVDLELLFDVVAGPDAGADVAWRLDLPAARHESLRDFRVAVLPWFDWVPVQPEVRMAVGELSAWLEHQGVKVETVSPDFDWHEHLLDYTRLLTASTNMTTPAEQRAASAAGQRALGNPIADAMADGQTMDFAAASMLLGRRAALKHQWRQFFRDWDVLITPTFARTAFEHRDDPQPKRMTVIDGQETPYFLQIFYPHVAIFCGLPATAFPAGLDGEGLPIGLQAVGPDLEDRTPLRFAQLLEREWKRFEPPPGY